MTAVGFCIRIAGAAVAMIGIPYGTVVAGGEWPLVIPMALGAAAAAFVIWYVVRIFNLAFDPTSAETPSPLPPPDAP